MFRTITWDEVKAKRNVAAHQGITFDEAATVFDDPLAFTDPDYQHSLDEHRFTTIGYSKKDRLLRVTHTEEVVVEYDVVEVRIISARKTDAKEREDYEEGL